MRTPEITIQDIAYVALFAALTAVLGLVPKIDLGFVPVPITAQTLGVMMAGAILGAKRGAASQALFVLLVAAGLPVLAGGRGGLGVFVGPTVGFLIAFPLAALVVGALTERLWTRLTFAKSLVINVVGGIGVVYALGIPGMALAGGLPLVKAATLAGAFIPGDLIKAGLAAAVAMFVKRGFPLIESSSQN